MNTWSPKSFLVSASLACLVFAATLWSSCSKDDGIVDPCQNKVCQNGGICKSGKCDCADGYEGDDCGYTWNGAFEGQWRATYTDSAGSLPFTTQCDLKKDPDAAVFRWNRFIQTTGMGMYWDDVRCEITDRVNFTFRPGQISPSGFFPTYRILAGGGKRNEAQTLIEGFVRLQNVQTGSIVRYELFVERQ